MQELDGGRYKVVMGELFHGSEGSSTMNILGHEVKIKTSVKERVKAFTILLGEIALSLPVASRLNKSGTLFRKYQSTEAGKHYYNKFLVENPQIKRSELSFEDFMDFRIAKLNGMAKELAIILSFWLILALSKAMIPDDDEDTVSKNLARNTYKIIRKGLLEVTFFTDPTSVQSLINSPVASFRTLVDIKKIIVNTLDVISDLPKSYDNPNKAIWSKGKNDNSPAFYYTSGKIPVINTIVNWLDLFDKPLPK